MDDPSPTWSRPALRLLVPITGVALLVQYVAGLWTNIYGPAAGFSANTSYPPYLVHYYVGVTLGLLSIVLLLVAVSHRRTAYALLSVVLLLSVLAAALLGQAFVGSTPNDPADSVAMGCAFLVAFASILCFGFLVFGAELAPRMGMSPPTPE